MMPQISFVKNKAVLTVPEGKNLMEALLEAKIPVASSCHSDGVCCKCVIQIISGAENLSRPNETEIRLGERNSLSETRRVSCQTAVLGNITIDTGYW